MTHPEWHVDHVLAAVDDHAAVLADIDDDHLAVAAAAHDQLGADHVTAWQQPADSDDDE